MPPRHTWLPRPVMIGQLVGAVGRGDVDLDHHQVRLVVQVKRLDVLVLDHDVIVGRR